MTIPVRRAAMADVVLFDVAGQCPLYQLCKCADQLRTWLLLPHPSPCPLLLALGCDPGDVSILAPVW